MRTSIWVPVIALSLAALPETRTPAPTGLGGPGGTVDVVSFGVTEVTADEVGPVQTLHVRFVIGNRRDAIAWTFDTSGVQLATGATTSRPLFVNANAATLPLVRIERGERATVDLFFPLPPSITEDPRATAFEVAWEVFTPARRLAGHAAFARDLVVSPRSRIDEVGTAESWWSDATYTWPIFWRVSGIVLPRPPTHMRVTGAPRGGFHVAAN
jgi:hypothetical protein